MKTLRNLSKEANELRERFQNEIIIPYIKSHGSLKGYHGQIYLLLPKYDRKNPFYKNVSRETAERLYRYLCYNQSQRRFAKAFVPFNQLQCVKSFNSDSLQRAFSRVWHNAVSIYGLNNGHWEAQAMALFNKIRQYGFVFYENDYNFGSHLYDRIRKANPFLVSVYEKRIDQLMKELA